ncbi:MAG: monovalent cation/H(+) antiporter subunit G [Spirochaetota bacterium]
MTWVAIAFFGLGAIFSIMGNLGVLVFPDVYTRLQASSTCTTTSVFSVLVACMVIAGFSPMTGKILVITLFFFVTNPIASHIIARFAWQSEIVPWRRSYQERRDLGGPLDG